MSSRVVVVGGGVVGLGCAHYLSRAGHAVTVVEQGTVGGGCSHANCGFIVPSHVLPLAGPGAIRDTLKTLFQRNSPLKVKFRFDPALWSWFYNFARRCNKDDMLAAGHAIQALLNSARPLYDELFRTESMDVEWQTRGLLFAFQSQRAMEHYAHTDHLLREKFNLGATRYDGSAVNELEPALKPGLAGAWHYLTDAHLRPDRLLSEWHRLLKERGVTFRERCTFRGFSKSDRRVGAVETDQGQLPADAVVVATGAWTPLLNKHLGCKVPVQPGKGYSITMARPKRCPAIPLIFEETRVAITPMQTGYRIGSTMEFAGYDATLNRSRLELLRAGARPYLVEPEAEPVTEEWWGWRPMVFDGKPIIGKVPAFENVILATGHGMLGVSMATATGKLVTELLDGNTPHVDPSPYAVTRFG